MDAAAVVGEGVVLAYGSHVAVEDSDFALPKGKLTAFIGPNGSGKSTLLGAISGLVAPAAGRLVVLGVSPSRARRQVAYVMQSSRVNESMPVTVREAVTMGCYSRTGYWGRLGPTERAAVAAALERLDITALARRHLRELSGGQRQRVFVAQALVQRGDVLLLDEPFTGLDVVSRAVIVDAVRQELDGGTTVAVSTHDLSEASGADHVIVMKGVVVASGPPASVLNARVLASAYGSVVRIAEGILVLDDPHAHLHEPEPR